MGIVLQVEISYFSFVYSYWSMPWQALISSILFNNPKYTRADKYMKVLLAQGAKYRA